jgi:hypothetical protein
LEQGFPPEMVLRVSFLAFAFTLSTLGNGSIRSENDISATPRDWETIIEDGAKGRGDETVSSQHHHAPDLVLLECSHGGGNRLLWRMTFAQPFVTEGTVLILYLDTDADEGTGRVGKWVQGTDRMLTLVNGESHAQAKSHVGQGCLVKCGFQGKTVTFEDDLQILAERIRAMPPEERYRFEWHFRTRVLCHTVVNPQDQDATVWVSGKVAVDPRRKRPRDEQLDESALVRDLVTRRRRDGTAEIRFTTTETVESRLVGPGEVVGEGKGGLRQNHAWNVPAFFLEEGGKRRIRLYDDLLERIAEVEIPIADLRAEKRKQAESGRIDVFLSYDERLGKETEGSAHVRWPVSGGIPFRRGHLRSIDKVRLFDAKGNEREIQPAVLSVWPDGSVRWLLVEFVADLPRDLDVHFVLEYGPEVHRQASVRNDIPNPVSWGEVLRWDEKASIRTNAGPGGMTLERGGAVHRILLFEDDYTDGDVASPFARRVRIHTFPEIPLTRIEHTLIVRSEDLFANLRALRLMFPPGGGAERIGEVDAVSDASSSSPYLGQITRHETETGTVVERERGTGQLPGWISRDGEKGKVILAVRRFAENWPKALIADEDRLIVDLFPELRPDEYSERSEPQERLYYWFDEGEYKLKRGVQKTHELLWGFFPAGQNSPNEKVLVCLFNNPPVLRAGAEWTVQSGAAGPFQPRKEGRFARYEDRVREGFEEVESRRESLQEFGFLNFGDWFGERGKNWGNLEYDLAHTLWLQWQRGGDYAYYRRAEEAATHMGDVDVVHHDPSPMNVGRMWGHSVGHTGGYFPEGSLEMEPIFLRGFWDLGHTWCEGMLHMYLATGEPRFRENGMLVADQLARFATVDYRMGTERTAGWPMIALTAAYELTGDPYYLNGAKIIAREVVRKQDPERGVWSHRIGECKHDPAHYGGKPFMAGVLLTGLSRLDRNLPVETEEDRSFRDAVAASILKGSDWLLNEAWVEDGGGFIYAQCSSFEGKVSHAGAWMVCEALAYATKISDDPKYIEKARISVATALETDPPSWGKALAMETRFMPYFLAALADRGLDSISSASKEQENQ